MVSVHQSGSPAFLVGKRVFNKSQQGGEKRDVYCHSRPGERGDSVYFLVTGAAHVMRGARVVHAYSPGEYFGELALQVPAPPSLALCAPGCEPPTAVLTPLLALQNDVPRSATIVAVGTCMCFVLQRKDVMGKTLHRIGARTYLASVPLLQAMSGDELGHIVNALWVRFFVQGDVVFEQGDVGDKLY